MVYITNYLRNANQNYNEVPPHTGQRLSLKKYTNNKCWRVWGERNPPILLVGI